MTISWSDTNSSLRLDQKLEDAYMALRSLNGRPPLHRWRRATPAVSYCDTSHHGHCRRRSPTHVIANRATPSVPNITAFRMRPLSAPYSTARKARLKAAFYFGPPPPPPKRQLGQDENSPIGTTRQYHGAKRGGVEKPGAVCGVIGTTQERPKSGLNRPNTKRASALPLHA